MKKFIKGRWFPLAIALVAILIIVFTLFFCGFRITYTPELKTKWTVISKCLNWGSVIALFIAIMATIWLLKKIADKQNKVDPNKKRQSMINSNTLRIKYAWNWWLRHNNAVFYWIALIVLTGYIVLNWDTCISMQFFQNFNGNNILFFCWILMVFLKIFRIKVKDVEIFRDLQNDFLNADLQHSINERQQLISQEEQAVTGCNQEEAPNNA